MSLLKVVAVLAFVAAASARPDSGRHGHRAASVHGASPAHGGYGPPPPPSYGTHERQYKKPSYAFEWVVKDDYSGNDYDHQEKRDGYNIEGSYHVLLPDGRVEKVTYTVTKDGGYVATVEFEGEVKHDKQYGKPPAPVYTQPPTYAPPPTPGYGHTTTPGYGHITTPGYGHTTTPGYRHTTTPGYGHTTTPGYGHTTTPGYRHTTTPGYGHTTTPGYGHTTTPGYGHTTTPGYGHPPIPVYGHPPAPEYGHA